MLCKIIENPEKPQLRTSFHRNLYDTQCDAFILLQTLHITLRPLPKLLLQLCTVYNPDSRAYAAVVTLDQWKLEGRQQGSSKAENKSQSCAVATRGSETFMVPWICATLSSQSNRILIRCATSSSNLATIYTSWLWNKHVVCKFRWGRMCGVGDFPDSQ